LLVRREEFALYQYCNLLKLNMSLFDVSSLTVAGVIALYNDMVATREDDSLAVTNQALRELSGVKGV
jgi:hypothetical protein